MRSDTKIKAKDTGDAASEHSRSLNDYTTVLHVYQDESASTIDFAATSDGVAEEASWTDIVAINRIGIEDQQSNEISHPIIADDIFVGGGEDNFLAGITDLSLG